MTNSTQPIEHFTLEQVEQRAKDMSWIIEDGMILDEEGFDTGYKATELHALLNAAAKELIGEPVAWVINNYNINGTWLSRSVSFHEPESGHYRKVTPLYTLKEIK